MNHYDEQYENDCLPKCVYCDTESPLTNTALYGWICDNCLADFEYSGLDWED